MTRGNRGANAGVGNGLLEYRMFGWRPFFVIKRNSYNHMKNSNRYWNINGMNNMNNMSVNGKRVVGMVNKNNSKNVSIFQFLQKRYFIPRPEVPEGMPRKANKLDSVKENGSSMKKIDAQQHHAHILYSPTGFKNVKKWDIWEWTFSFASLLQLAGFLSTDILQLRALSLFSAFFFMLAHANRRFFVGWFWALSFTISNIMAIYIIWEKRYHNTLQGTVDDEAYKVYRKYFEKYHITPYEFKQLLKISHRTSLSHENDHHQYHYSTDDKNNDLEKSKQGNKIGNVSRTIEPNTSLTVVGVPTEKMYLLLEGTLSIVNSDGNLVGYVERSMNDNRDDPCFIGEFTLLNLSVAEKGATATVKTETECNLIWWYCKDVKKLMKRGIIKERKFLEMFTKSMSQKIIESNQIQAQLIPNQSLKSMIQILAVSEKKCDQKTRDHLLQYCKAHGIDSKTLQTYAAEYNYNIPDLPNEI